VRETFTRALPASLQREDLWAALCAALNGMLHEAADLQDSLKKIEPRLRELMQPSNA